MLIVSADTCVFLSVLRQFVPMHIARRSHYDLDNWRCYLHLTGKRDAFSWQPVLQIKANVAGGRT